MPHKKDRRMFSKSDDERAMTKQVQATHVPESGREVDVKPVFQFVNQILIQPISSILDGPDKKHEETSETTSSVVEPKMLDSHAFIVYKISSKLSGKYDSGGGDAHGSTMVLLKYMSGYAWHAKVVLTLSAFASTFVKFLHVAKNPQFDAINKLIMAAVDVSRCVIEFQELPSEYILESTPPMSIASAHIPIASYWVIRSIVACASQSANLAGMRKESTSSITKASEISSLAQQISSINEKIKSDLTQCKKYIADKREEKALQNKVNLPMLDNMEILRTLIYAKDDLHPLIDGTTKATASLEVLRGKHVLLLISDLDLSEDEIMVLDNCYKDVRVRDEICYEMVWVPVVDKATWNDVNRQKFEYLQSMMAWYSVRDPFIIEPSVIKYIREVWNFKKRAIVVALDPQGKVSSTNAIHMIWIWGNLAFPFSSEREESIWKQEIWSLELLVDGIDHRFFEWWAEGKYICLYGGEDIEWIEKFTTAAVNVAKAGKFELEMVYVGKSNAKERMQKSIDRLATTKVSTNGLPVTSMWFFWLRLESMLYSKLQQGVTIENDQIMSEIMTLLSYDGSDQGWAIFFKGSFEMARAKGDNVLKFLHDFDKWKDNFERVGLVSALNDYLIQPYDEDVVTRLILPGNIGSIPERVVCAECGRPMEKQMSHSSAE